MLSQRRAKVGAAGPSRQRIERERNADQHALAEIADGRDEQRTRRQPGIGDDFGDVLVLEGERIELEFRRRAALISLDIVFPPPE